MTVADLFLVTANILSIELVDLNNLLYKGKFYNIPSDYMNLMVANFEIKSKDLIKILVF